MEELKKRFVELTSIDGHSYAAAEAILKTENPELSRKQFTAWDKQEEVKEYRNKISKIISNYHNKKNAKHEGVSLFDFTSPRHFYEWYLEQPQSCHYCKTPAETLQKLFDKESPVLETKRLRGYSLEIDRIDSKSNIYSPGNCVLACYFCNNHKSDIISEADFRHYFAESIGRYLADKAAE